MKNTSYFENTKIAFQSKSNYQLWKAYFLFKLFEYPKLISFGSIVLRLSLTCHLPIRRLIKATIFEQFCGGEKKEECSKVVNRMAKQNVKSILDYSVEGKKKEEDFDYTCKEILSILDFAKGNANIPFVVFKPTGFGRVDLFIKKGKKITLTESEKEEWKRIEKRLESVCEKGSKIGKFIMIDAEESWMQDAVDDLVEKIMKKRNRERCVVWNTLQMYRHDRLAYLKDQYQKAKQSNYSVGFKVVRGAYMEKEREVAEREVYPSPIQIDKAHSDKDYNEAIRFIVERLDIISLFAGTHNEDSCFLLKNLIEEKGIDKSFHKLWFGQLFGMSDNVSYQLASEGFNVAKYLPYGPIKDVMPYLIRRANENTSVAGQSGRELVLIKKELRRRKKQNKMILETITAEKFEEKRKEDNTTVLDVRTQKEFDEMNLNPDRLINFNDSDVLEEELGKLDKSKTYLVHCRSGKRSLETCYIMEEMGFKEVYNLDGGIMAWHPKFGMNS